MRILVSSLTVLLLSVSLAVAGNPHFTTCSVVESGNTLIATGVETGLGNETQVHLVLTAEAACINSGGKGPKAANKQTVTEEGTFPVQNGRAEFDLLVTATFQPSCSPPMSVAFSNISVCDDEHDVCCSLE